MSNAPPDLPRPLRELDELLGELETLLKNQDVTTALAERGINMSLFLVATEGLRAYARGDKQQAAEDFATAAEEIQSRLGRTNEA